jgi:hypothetical protein
MKGITPFLAAALAVSASAAGANSFQVNGGLARSYGKWGGELSAGYRFQFAIVDITPLAGAFITSRSDYRQRLDSSGFEHCYAVGGGIVGDENCRAKTRGFGAIEAGVSIPLAARIAVGGRYIGGQVRPYGSVAVPLFSKLGIKVNGGQHYAAAGLNLSF